MGAIRRLGFPRRGEVFLVDFEPILGAEIGKTRPALILQNDVGNRHASTTIVAALSSALRGPRYPTEVLIRSPEGGLERDSLVRLDHIRTVDKARLLRRLGVLQGPTMEEVDRAVEVSLGLVEV